MVIPSLFLTFLPPDLNALPAALEPAFLASAVASRSINLEAFLATQEAAAFGAIPF